MKTSTIKSCILALAAAAAFSASADLLYWTISNPTESWTTPGEATPISFDYATVRADGTLLNVYNQDGDTGYWQLYANDDGRSADPVYSGLFDSSATSSLLVELWDASDQKVGWQTYTMSSLMESVWKGNRPESAGSGVSVFTVSQVVPEPTSGLLLALGGALLALRRRRAA